MNSEVLVAVARPPARAPLQQSGRIPALDSLRGFLLVWMTLTHLPTRVSAYSNQAVGYVSAAEGFIFMAALLVGRLYRREEERDGPRRALENLFRRTKRIYRYHAALLALAFAGGGAAAVYLHRVPLANLLDYFLRSPKTAATAALVLLYNPPLLDILPLYIIFLLLSPLLLRAAERRGWGPVLCASAAVWLLAQLHLREWIFAVAARSGFPVPLNETGAFDLFGWQFLWTAGLAVGWSRPGGRPIPRWAVAASAAIAAVLFVCRHAPFDALTGPALFGILVDKWRLGILRIVDFAAISILLVWFGQPLARAAIARPLGAMGRVSLEVFSAHVLLCLVVLGLGEGPDAHFTLWQDALILGITLPALFAVARYAERRKRLAHVRLEPARVQ